MALSWLQIVRQALIRFSAILLFPPFHSLRKIHQGAEPQQRFRVPGVLPLVSVGCLSLESKHLPCMLGWPLGRFIAGPSAPIIQGVPHYHTVTRWLGVAICSIASLLRLCAKLNSRSVRFHSFIQPGTPL